MIAGVIAVLLSVLAPAGYFFISHQYMLGTLDTQAELNANIVTSLVMANPTMWQFEQIRLAELLERRSVASVPEGRRIFPSLSVEENLLVGAYRGRPHKPSMRSSSAFRAPGSPDTGSSATKLRKSGPSKPMARLRYTREKRVPGKLARSSRAASRRCWPASRLLPPET